MQRGIRTVHSRLLRRAHRLPGIVQQDNFFDIVHNSTP
jgi:hypothetical protein